MLKANIIFCVCYLLATEQNKKKKHTVLWKGMREERKSWEPAPWRRCAGFSVASLNMFPKRGLQG